MPAFLNNPWVIGIGGGIFSGFIVTLASRAILSRRDQREYNQKVLSANREAIYAVRLGISEGHIPDATVVEALIEATSRKYGVDSGDLYEPSEIAQELIKEVMDSSFISSSTKEEYCGKLSSLFKPSIPEKVVELKKVSNERILRDSSSIEDYRSRMVWMMSMMMGILVAMMTVVLAFTKTGVIENKVSIFKDKIAILVPMLLALVSTTLGVLMVTIRKAFKKRDERDELELHKDSKKEIKSKESNA